MGTLTIRKIDDDLKEKLRVRAARHGRSMEAEVREIIAAAVDMPPAQATKGLATITHEMFAGLGWDGSTLPSRDEPARYVDLDE
jgi:plasmid stability protein